VSAEVKARRPVATPGPVSTDLPAETPTKPPVERPRETRPFLLDFFPLEGSEQTRLARFYDRLREGRLSTTRCTKDGELHWPPRTACPKCHTEELEWIDLPERGQIYAFSAVLGGAPLGMEADVPFAVGLVDLEGVPLRLFGRIEGRPWAELRLGGTVRVEPFALGDGRVFYRFRSTD
jgi:uncharacterized OB-fold protein